MFETVLSETVAGPFPEKKTPQTVTLQVFFCARDLSGQGKQEHVGNCVLISFVDFASAKFSLEVLPFAIFELCPIGCPAEERSEFLW